MLSYESIVRSKQFCVEDDSLKYSKFMESLVKSFHYIK